MDDACTALYGVPEGAVLSLITAARTLSRRATGILLAHLLADDLHQPTVHHPGQWEHTAPARHALP